MSNFMENGPSNHNGETEQVWERPWTLEEMQKSSTNWSLAADSGLFLFLQDFSQRMLSKTHEIEKQLDGLIQDTKATDSRLHTVFNDFLMLSNTQFIENRVYDEEVEDPAPKPETMEKQPEQEKTREQKEAELIPKIQEAVNYGLKVLESAFEQLDIKAGNSDSEDEETLEKVEPILEAKDLYVDRPLPYLIGSQAFMDQDDVGLGDLSSDEMSIRSGRDSIIESDVEEGDEVRDNDMHIHMDSVVNILRDDQDEMFKPPKMEDEEYSPFGGKGGLFSGGKGLFDDDDEVEPPKTKKIPTGAVSIFPENKLFGSPNDSDSLESKGSKSPSKPKVQAAPKRASYDNLTVFLGKRKSCLQPPVGAISMFGPGTKNILEGLKKRRPSTSEESAKSEESGPPPEAVKSSPALGASEKTHSKSLFSDDEDSQLFASETASKSKPTTQNKPSKAPLSIFDDEEEEDLFSSTPKSKSDQVKKTSLQPKKPVSSLLFSDDEDQWMSSKLSRESLEVKSSGMKSSVSAPSRLPSVKTPQKDGLFDDDDDDLFAATNESRFFKRTVSGAPSLFESTEEENAPNVAKDKIAEEKKPSEDSTDSKKKPVGAVSLFGGIDVLADKQDTSKKHTKNQEEITDGDKLQKEGPPPMESKGTKAKKTALSLFDDDDDDDDEDMNTDEIIPAPKTSKSTEKNALKDHGPQMKSTGVFQDEELLFSHMQQRDNDPDVDLFATSPKPSVPSPSSVKPVVPTLFGDDEDNDLFSSAKPKAPPKVPEKSSKPKTNEMDKSTLTSSKVYSEINLPICFFQASLVVNPASLLPGAVPRIPGAVSVIPGLAPASLPAAAKNSECPVSGFLLLQGRAKGAVRRRPQTRAARQLAAQQSEEAVGESTSIQADEPIMAASLPTFNPVSVRPSALTIPVSTPAPAKSPDEAVRPKRFLDSGDDLFDSDLFATKPVPSSKHKAKTPEEGHKKASKTEAIIASKKDQASSIFDSHEDDLFATVKQKNVQKGKQMSFLEDDDDDIFGAGKSKSADSKNSKAEASSAKPDIFQDDVKEPPKAQKKPEEVSSDASLFDDDVDIFADLTGTTKPKEKKAKKKLETKSIFADDMDDIFSTGATKPTVKPSSKSKKNQPAQDPVSSVETGSNIFDDPLNAFGGN
uniref:WASH complex subunit FAM21-like n=1 Tax=Sinocyclocheilus anshuiensis TaxID=1608454 RepID=A0A671NK49_9TELE